jgi:hypothetical protein
VAIGVVVASGLAVVDGGVVVVIVGGDVVAGCVVVVTDGEVIFAGFPQLLQKFSEINLPQLVQKESQPQKVV